jgi:site-specific DNA recombinase
MARPMSLGTPRNARVRCAIYTRKSLRGGLEQEFNSLQAQREACEAFITSQRHEGWVCLVGANQIDIHLRLTRLGALLDVAAAPSAADEETQILSVPVRLRRSEREITMRIDGTDPFATAKPDARLVKLLIRARRFNAALLHSDDAPFAALAKREGVSPSYFTRLVRLSYLAPDITQAILDGRQPRELNADKLLAHSRLPLAWNEQRTALGFA